ncbi:DUF4232 domain-containing protein [Streptomyces sp. P01-B04]|uniref:DUF4232 domain-containing protein n=1 Tax=Streptomyces poriferorum TaxID=2798799 RepID=UPI001C5E3254|nr:DUF4232 domain-containing protein [Streptomyces poriferorum]MBW5251758.1 DUF4232 domain-containing protein [Streptomyces poriferorum]MBW5261989.1 DUF4232 domain-containing protein [Streptomyces poriferorum]
MRAHRITFAALVVAAGLSLTACQNGDDGAAASDPSPASSASAASSAGGGSGSGGSDQDSGKESGTGSDGKGTADPAGSGSGSGDGTAPKCTTDGLEITAQDGFIDGDPDGSVVVALTNGSGADCVISGFAGVDLKTNAGDISATRKGEPGDPYTLKNGKEIDFYVSYPLNETGGSGVRITGLVVTPPNETKSVTLAWPGNSSLPVTDGSGSSVLVGPIGSAGQGG